MVDGIANFHFIDCANVWVLFLSCKWLYGHMLVNFCYYLFRLLETFVGIAMFSSVFGYLSDEFEKFMVWKTIRKCFFIC
jgi:hypothetical protein